MRRYYNENPQVEAWKERYDKLVVKYNGLVDEYNALAVEKNELLDICQSHEEEMEEYNRLPWYERLFYKFCV